MAKVNRFDDLAKAPAEDRRRIAERLYDEDYAEKAVPARPLKLRGKRIALYKRLIGSGNRCILELGCGGGDLTYALVDNAAKIVATDISPRAIQLAEKRKESSSLEGGASDKIEFKPMSAVHLDLPDGAFDWVVSTSVIEHLHPDDVDHHLREVWRVLEAGGHYLIWCPNGLGHHKDREGHLTMLSYKEWTGKLAQAGFRRFRSTLTSRPPLVGAGWKIALESFLSRLGIKFLWSHLGVRNVLLVASK